MAVKFEFVSAFLCERSLTEADGISSAIRMVDVFFIPEDTSEDAVVQFFAVVSLKTVPVPVNTKVEIGVTLVRASGEREKLPSPGSPYTLDAYQHDPSIPAGFNLAIGFRV